MAGGSGVCRSGVKGDYAHASQNSSVVHSPVEPINTLREAPAIALRSTVYRATLEVSDLDRGVYGTFPLTLARHPSETEERMMMRLLAFALHADAALGFGRGLSTEDEADLWLRDATGVTELWIDVGLPDERDVRKACGKAHRVVVLAYDERRTQAWWDSQASALQRLKNLTVLSVSDAEAAALTAMAARAMTLNCTIQDAHVWFASPAATVELAPTRVLTP